MTVWRARDAAAKQEYALMAELLDKGERIVKSIGVPYLNKIYCLSRLSIYLTVPDNVVQVLPDQLRNHTNRQSAFNKMLIELTSPFEMAEVPFPGVNLWRLIMNRGFAAEYPEHYKKVQDRKFKSFS